LRYSCTCLLQFPPKELDLSPQPQGSRAFFRLAFLFWSPLHPLSAGNAVSVKAQVIRYVLLFYGDISAHFCNGT